MKLPRFPRWLYPRFSLRTLFVVVTLLCIPLTWIIAQRKLNVDRLEALKWLFPRLGMRDRDMPSTESGKSNPAVSAVRTLNGLGQSSLSAWLFGRQPGLQLLEIDESKLASRGKYGIKELKGLFPEASIAVLRGGVWKIVSDGAHLYTASPPPYRFRNF